MAYLASCAAGLRRASWKWVSQGCGRAGPMTVEPPGRGPCACRWRLPWLPSLCPCGRRRWHTKEGCIHPGARIWWLCRAQHRPHRPPRSGCAFPAGGPSSLCNPPSAGEAPFLLVKAFALCKLVSAPHYGRRFWFSVLISAASLFVAQSQGWSNRMVTALNRVHSQRGDVSEHCL